MYLKRLGKISGLDAEKYLYPCIEDLVTNGLTSARFSSSDSMPSRQDITQYIAAWFKYTGISADECRDWMIGYCVDILSEISSSSKSRIRHSTKSNIKFIFKSDVNFNCGCENNAFKASCDKNCPVYNRMFKRNEQRKAREATRSYEVEHMPQHSVVEIPSVKETYIDQFKKALEIVEDNVKQGVPGRHIVTLLNDRGLKTRTGRKWTPSILRAEINRYNYEPENTHDQMGLETIYIKKDLKTPRFSNNNICTQFTKFLHYDTFLINNVVTRYQFY